MTEVFDAFLRANLAAGVAILAVIAARPLVRRLAGPEAAYRLWILAPLCALAALLPRPAAELASVPAAPVSALWLIAWAAGAGLALLALLLAQYRFLNLAAAGRAGPAMVGVICPRFVTPADYRLRFTPQERDLIRLHERAHLVRSDPKTNAAVALIRALCWFNPLIHLGARLARLDQELACDAQVVAAHPGIRRAYAQTMLKAATPSGPLFGCAWAGGLHPVEIRIRALSRPAPGQGTRNAATLATAAAGLALAIVVWSAQPLAPPKPQVEPPPQVTMMMRLSEASLPAGLVP